MPIDTIPIHEYNKMISDYEYKIQKLTNKIKQFNDNNTLLKDEEIWLQIYIAYAQSTNFTNSDYAASWADECLETFKEKFR